MACLLPCRRMRAGRARARIQARRGDQRVRQDRAGRGPARRPRAAVSVQVGQVSGQRTSRSTSTTRRLRSSAHSPRCSRTSRSSRMAGRWSRRSATGRLVAAVRSFVRELRAGGRATSPSRSNPARSIFIDQGYVDARIIYPIGSPDSEFSIRTTAAPELGDYLKLALRYHAARRRQSSDGHHQQLGNGCAQPDAGCAPRRASPARHRAHPHRATTICCSCFAW